MKAKGGEERLGSWYFSSSNLNNMIQTRAFLCHLYPMGFQLFAQDLPLLQILSIQYLEHTAFKILFHQKKIFKAFAKCRFSLQIFQSKGNFTTISIETDFDQCINIPWIWIVFLDYMCICRMMSVQMWIVVLFSRKLNLTGRWPESLAKFKY